MWVDRSIGFPVAAAGGITGRRAVCARLIECPARTFDPSAARDFRLKLGAQTLADRVRRRKRLPLDGLDKSLG